jgi:hypothetical protein
MYLKQWWRKTWHRSAFFCVFRLFIELLDAMDKNMDQVRLISDLRILSCFHWSWPVRYNSAEHLTRLSVLPEFGDIQCHENSTVVYHFTPFAGYNGLLHDSWWSWARPADVEYVCQG